jgi:GntR family transcriptional regulator
VLNGHGLAYGLVASYCDPVRIDEQSPLHPYEQVAAWLREEIATGRIGPRVPPLLELAGQTGASVATVRRALKILDSEGITYVVRGRGTFVRDRG